MTDNRLLTAIDCCRPDGRELLQEDFQDLAARLPERPDLAELLKRSQQFDSRAAEALDDVPIPAGLESRLLEKLRSTPPPVEIARSEEPISDLMSEPASETAPEPTTQLPSRAVGWPTLAGLALATAATIAIAMIWQGAKPADPPRTLAQLQDAWHTEVQSESQWESTAAPAGFPISNQVNAMQTQWVRIDKATIAYRLTAAGSRHATYLFVTQLAALGQEAQGLRPTPPREPVWTQDRAIGQWYEKDLVYVLLAEGPLPRYREALRQSHSGALAIRFQRQAPIV